MHKACFLQYDALPSRSKRTTLDSHTVLDPGFGGHSALSEVKIYSDLSEDNVFNVNGNEGDKAHRRMFGAEGDLDQTLSAWSFLFSP